LQSIPGRQLQEACRQLTRRAIAEVTLDCRVDSLRRSLFFLQILPYLLLDPTLLTFDEGPGLPLGATARDGDANSSVRIHTNHVATGSRVADEHHLVVQGPGRHKAAPVRAVWRVLRGRDAIRCGVGLGGEW
jgi:hypothetical protein